MSHPWTGPQQIGKVKKPKVNNESPMPPGESWWMSGDFYAQAKERFPESGTAEVDRSRVYTRGPEVGGFNERVRVSKGRAS